MTDVLKDKKIVYAYMLKNGSFTTGYWNQYLGEFDVDKGPSIEKMFEIGVDWDKTLFPQYMSRMEFVATEAPSLKNDTLLGDIVLKDGQIFKVGIVDVDSLILDLVEKYALLTEDKKGLDVEDLASFWNKP